MEDVRDTHVAKGDRRAQPHCLLSKYSTAVFPLPPAISQERNAKRDMQTSLQLVYRVNTHTHTQRDVGLGLHHSGAGAGQAAAAATN